MAAEAAKPTNEELIERLQAAGEGTPGAAAIMETLWAQNIRLVRLIVRKLTGLSIGEQGFEDMEQQAYFSFHAAAFAYDPAAGLAFSTVISRRIKWELCRYYERGGFTIRIPTYMKQRYRDCIKKKKELETETGRAVSNEAALATMGLSPDVIARTLVTLQKLKTVSLEAEAYTSSDGDGVSLLDSLADGVDIEADVIEQVWEKELHDVLMKALNAIPEMEREIITRRYFADIPFSQQAREYGVSRQTILNRADKGYEAIRGGQYGPELAEFMPSVSAFKRAFKRVSRARNDMRRLQLSDDEKELLAL